MSNCSDCAKCPKEPCKGCEMSIGAECIIITNNIVCVQGKYFIEASTTVADTIKSIVCRLIEIDDRLTSIEQTCCTVTPVCPIITIKKITQ